MSVIVARVSVYLVPPRPVIWKANVKGSGECVRDCVSEKDLQRCVPEEVRACWVREGGFSDA